MLWHYYDTILNVQCMLKTWRLLKLLLYRIGTNHSRKLTNDMLIHSPNAACRPLEMSFFVQLCSSWQDSDWHSASRGPSAIAELLVINGCGCAVYDYRPSWSRRLQRAVQRVDWPTSRVTRALTRSGSTPRPGKAKAKKAEPTSRVTLATWAITRTRARTEEPRRRPHRPKPRRSRRSSCSLCRRHWLLVGSSRLF